MCTEYEVIEKQVKNQLGDFIQNNKTKVEKFQQSIFSAIGSLVYSYFMYNMKIQSTGKILTPEIKEVKYFLSFNTPFIDTLSKNFMRYLYEDEIYKTNKEQINSFDTYPLFNNNEKYNELLDQLITGYIFPNIQRRLPETIALKFGFNNPENQTFYETNSCEFKVDSVIPMIEYVIHETMLHILNNWLYQKPHSSFLVPEEKLERFNLFNGNLLIIDHDNAAITPIIFDDIIIENEVCKNVLTFVTDTKFTNTTFEEETEGYIVNTGHTNKCRIISFN